MCHIFYVVQWAITYQLYNIKITNYESSCMIAAVNMKGTAKGV